MEIRNRIVDVAKLRSNICQDFLKMVATSNWQQRLYDKAKYEVENNNRFRDKYIAVYNKMRDLGINQFAIGDMDVSLIVEVLCGMKDAWGVRRLTLRESLRLQGFPPEFYFPNTIKLEDAYKQIGNSVSVPVIRNIAKQIYAVLVEEKNVSEENR